MARYQRLKDRQQGKTQELQETTAEWRSKEEQHAQLKASIDKITANELASPPEQVGTHFLELLQQCGRLQTIRTAAAPAMQVRAMQWRPSLPPIDR